MALRVGVDAGGGAHFYRCLLDVFVQGDAGGVGDLGDAVEGGGHRDGVAEGLVAEEGAAFGAQGGQGVGVSGHHGVGQAEQE